MRIMRVQTPEGEVVYGRAEGDLLRVHEGDPFGDFAPTGRVWRLAEVAVLAPVEPSKIVVVGRNYPRPGEAAFAGGEPLILMKPATTVIGPGEAIVRPPEVTRLKLEAELAVVIGRRARHVSVEDAPAHVLGYTVANDLGAVDLMEKDGQWVRGKSYDTFCPLGPAVVTGLDPSDLLITCRVNGRECQRASTAEMFHSVARLVAFASRVMTLLPGDVIVTGTPPGAVEVVPGDLIEMEIAGIGTLANPVVAG
jgi:2-keto-4-pentenoate hydratase/2-oxohepta-3-ene-1,7-dioic acid hydratase in catechol pathway